jgi:hypothetical protein
MPVDHRCDDVDLLQCRRRSSMASTRTFPASFAVAAIGAIALVAAATSVRAQSPAPHLITQAINPANLTTLAGNTRPEANAANDRGMVPDSLPLNHMLLQLRRSDGQEQAFETLIDQLHDRSSPNFHKWLTIGDIGTASVRQPRTSTPSRAGSPRTALPSTSSIPTEC